MADSIQLHAELRSCVGKHRSFPSRSFLQLKRLTHRLLDNPHFPSDGTLHSPKKEFQPRVGFAWDISKTGKSVLRASYGILLRPAEHVVAGRFDHRQRRAAVWHHLRDDFRFDVLWRATVPPTWPNIVPVTPGGGIPFGAAVRVFSKDYANPRIYTANAQFEQELAQRPLALFRLHTLARACT